jgi:hypothetical protein
MPRYKIRGLTAANSAYSPRSRGCRIPIALAALILGSPAWDATPISDVDHPAPFDYGFGLVVRVPSGSISAWNKMLDLFSLRRETPFQTQADIGRLPHALVAPPTAGPPDAAQTGMSGSVLPWPIIPLHMALLPNGQVMTYGTDQNGKQGTAFYFDVWDPTQPYETSQTVLANTTGTDIFCSGMGLLTNGSLLITGGDLTINGKRNYSNAQVNLYAPGAAALTPNGVMNYPRWYPADVPLSNGDQMIVGGRSNQDPTVPVTTPEYYSVADNTFTPLTGAQESTNLSWFYPRVFVDSTGAIDLFDASGRIAVLSAAGSGSIAESTLKLQRGLDNLPTVMYAPGQILSLRNAPTAGADGYTYPVQVINVAGPRTIEAAPAAPGPGRQWANLTVLADGTLLLNGGSSPANQLQNFSTTSYLFSPANQVWTPAATAAEPRLCHSAALLLPDGTALTGGGGAPGPVNELNA